MRPQAGGEALQSGIKKKQGTKGPELSSFRVLCGL